MDKTRSKLCSHLPLAPTSILLGARRWAIFVISASQSTIIDIFVRKFTTVGVIFYHTILALHGFDFWDLFTSLHSCAVRAVIPRKSP